MLAQVPVTRITPPESAVDAVFKRHDSEDAPGCSVAVIDAGKVVLKKSYGMADIGLGVPMTSSTTSWIPYSEARVFVALAVAMLARDGVIALDDPIRKHVPEVPAYASTVTIRQLVHHTSGLADYGALAGPGWEIFDRMPEDEMFRILTRWDKLGFVPGQDKMYSNTDYALLKILVERTSKTSLHDYLDRNLLAPLGMTSTRIGANQADAVPGHVLFHDHAQPGDRYRKRLLSYRVSPTGGIAVTSSLDDLIRWEQALDNPALGLRALLAGLEAGALPHTSDSGIEGFAFGKYRTTRKDLPLETYHGVGEFMYLVQEPSTRLSVATLCNAYDGMWSFGADVARLYALPAPAASDPEPATPAAPPRVLATPKAIPLSELQLYVGEYRSADGKGADVAIAGDALVITLRGGSKLPALVALGNGQFKTRIDDWTALFEFKDLDGSGITLSSWDVTNDESGGPTLRRWTPWQPDAQTLRGYAGTYVGDDVEVVLHVRTDGERVLVSSRGLAETALEPSDKADHFLGLAFYGARFERNASGRVTALVLDPKRVKGMRYTRR